MENVEQTITLFYKDGRTENFSVYSLSRWFCMIEAFEYIKEFAESNNIKLDSIDFIKKPASLFEYIKAKQPKIENDILYKIKKYGINTDYIFELC